MQPITCFGLLEEHNEETKLNKNTACRQDWAGRETSSQLINFILTTIHISFTLVKYHKSKKAAVSKSTTDSYAKNPKQTIPDLDISHV